MNNYSFRLQTVASKADGGKLLAVPMVHVVMPATRDTSDQAVETYKASLNESEQGRFQAVFDVWQKSVGLDGDAKDAKANVKNLDKLKASRDAQAKQIADAQAELDDLNRNIAVAEVLLAVAKATKA